MKNRPRMYSVQLAALKKKGSIDETQMPSYLEVKFEKEKVNHERHKSQQKFESIQTNKISVDKSRMDKFKNKILKHKYYKISFRDEIEPSKQLHDIKIVENWKEYNVMHEYESKQACCVIF